VPWYPFQAILQKVMNARQIGKLADSIDLKEGVILHLDDKGLPLEIEILDAAKLSMIDEISVFPAFGRKQEELTAAI